MEMKTVWVSTKDEASSLDTDLREGWVTDPVLMPTGRPNIVEGLAAIYHLIKYTKEEVAAMVEEKDKKPGEFNDVVETRDVPHGPVPEGFTVWNLYQKNMIVVKRTPQTKEEKIP